MADAKNGDGPVNLKPGDHHYRAYVGPPADYDRLAGLQFSLLFAAGLRENHTLLDVGCGSLRAGRLLIPYLQPGRYHGVEPNRWLVKDGIKRELGRGIVRLKRPRFRYVDDFSASGFGVDFDYALAQSVFSHTYPDLLVMAMKGIKETLAPGGLLFATFVEGEPEKRGSGWLYPQNVPYQWEEVEGMANEAGLAATRISWPHPRQKWFIAAQPSGMVRANALAHSIRPPASDG